jgi:hypothetical protein
MVPSYRERAASVVAVRTSSQQSISCTVRHPALVRRLIACAAMANRARPARADGSVVIVSYDFRHIRVSGGSGAKYDFR